MIISLKYKEIVQFDGHNNIPRGLNTIHSFNKIFKGVVNFKKKIFADNLITPTSFKMSTSFFLQSKRN